jgi:outer membrane protein insertion porin family
MQTGERSILSPITGAGNLDREVLKTDTERLTAYYYENGFIDVRIDEPKIDRQEDGLTITIKVDEGEQYHFGKITTAARRCRDRRAPAGEVRCAGGRDLQAEPAAQDITALTERYGDRSYAFVNVTPPRPTSTRRQDASTSPTRSRAVRR